MTIKEETNHRISLCISVLGAICGLNDKIDEGVMKPTIVTFFRNHYPNLTLSEITKAFNLYAAQKLSFKDSIYQNMNPTFIGKVMVSYLEYKRKENLKELSTSTPLELSEAKIPIEDQRKNSFEFIKKIYSKEGKFPIIANWVDAYFHLHTSGEINTTQKEFNEEKDKIRASLKNEVNKKKSQGIKECFEKLEVENETSIKKEAAKNIVQKYVRAL